MSWDSSTPERRDCNSEDAGSSPRSQHQIIIAGHQPVYLPGIIVMAKIALADRFMWVGHCDYQPRSFHSRNYIRGFKEPLMLTVPVRRGTSINDTVPLPDHAWRRRHLRSIKHAYSHRPYFKEYFPELEATLLLPCPPSLAALNIGLANVFCRWLEIRTPIYYSEDWDIWGHKTAMLVDMCRKLGATDYLSSPGEARYVKKEEMNGFAHHYIKFTHPTYDQGHKVFMPNLSVIDLLFNCGPAAAQIVREAGHV